MSRLLWACILGGTLANGLARAGEEPAAVEQVVPVAWPQFHAPQQPDDDYRRAAELVLHGARCNLAWAPGAAERIERQGTALSGRQNHDVIRPACAASCALAVALTTGIYDPRVTGIGRDEATARTVRLIRAAAGAHNRASWNYPWQSALWATTLSQAGWLLWDQLDPPTRRLIADIAQFEADRFLVPGYRVPYWNGKDGDTKAFRFLSCPGQAELCDGARLCESGHNAPPDCSSAMHSVLTSRLPLTARSREPYSCRSDREQTRAIRNRRRCDACRDHWRNDSVGNGAGGVRAGGHLGYRRESRPTGAERQSGQRGDLPRAGPDT
jgi:hypothetical protein